MFVLLLSACVGILGSGVRALGTSCPDSFVAFSGACYLFGPHALDYIDTECMACGLANSVVGAVGTSCPDSFVAFSGACYLFGPHALDFNDAKFYCEDHSESRLVRVDSDVENRFVEGQIRRYTGQDWWMGIQYKEGQWQWTGEKAKHSNIVNSTSWTVTAPEQSGYNCGYFNHAANFAWANGDCVSKRTPICQLFR